MKPSTLKEIKTELNHRSENELLELCLRLVRFKKENKELLTYLLFENTDEEQYIKGIKEEIDEQFENINRKSYFFIRKSVRRILKTIKKYIRYSKKKETEVELLLYFCTKLKNFKPTIKKSAQLQNSYHRQITLIRKILETLHEDLQYDFEIEIRKLEDI
jgi:hypothetical protein